MKNLSQIAFLLCLIAFLSLNLRAEDECDERLNSLTLDTKILKIAAESDGRYVRFVLDVENTFTNEGSEPIIILQPVDAFSGRSSIFWYGGISLKTNEGASTMPLLSGLHLPSIYKGKFYEDLAAALDKKTPPGEYTRIIKPKEAWTWTTKADFGISVKDDGYGYDKGWEKISALKTPVNARLSYSIFPSNIGHVKPNLGKKLKKRWKKQGILYYCDTHSLIESKPFVIDFQNIKI
jgi:hypothetical protein